MQEWFAAALKEPWRDEQHEAEMHAAGTLIEDRRSAP
jgi:glutathione S-transferase